MSIHKPKITTFRDSDGDWSILFCNDKKIAENHSLRIEDILTWLDKNDIITWTDYHLENREIEENGNEIDYTAAPKWLQEFYDEFAIEEDGY